MSANIAVVVAYPSKHPDTGEPLSFDMKYYLSTHVPLIERVWGPWGLSSWSINTFPSPCPLTGETPPYLVQTTCFFDTVENFKMAMIKGGDETKPDVAKFSNVFPVIWIGETGKSGTLKGPESDGVAQA